jgi:hypothetical protein
LGEGNDDGLQDQKVLSNKVIYKKNEEQGWNKLVKIYSRGYSSLYAIPPSRTDGLGGGMSVEKISSPPCIKVGKIGA